MNTKGILIGFMLLVAALLRAPDAFATEFDLTLILRNKSDSWKRLTLEKGRILEMAGIDQSEYQSIIIYEGEGLVLIPPHETIRRKIRGLCMHKGLKFPPEGIKVAFSPFIAKGELLDKSQAEVHEIAATPSPSIAHSIVKGYSDARKNGLERDRDEAFQDAITQAARQGGMDIASETIMENLSVIRNYQRIRIHQRSVRLRKIIHEEYNKDSGQYLFIGEFEVQMPAPDPVLAGH